MKLLLFILGVLTVLTVGAQAQMKVVYPDILERSGDSFGYKILDLALQKSGVVYTIVISKSRASQERAKTQLDNGEISVLDVGTSPEFENRWDAVYFPIDRGISGYRLLFINKKLNSAFASVKSLGDLQKFEAGQGLGWADVKILRGAGIKVQEVPVFQSLFKMVNAQRFGFFPLGVEEIKGFQDQFAADLPDTVIQPTLALHYPFGRLFFVQKGNKILADALSKGLRAAFEDGSFQEAFNIDPEIKKSLAFGALSSRMIIEVPNPNLTEPFLKIPQKYFFTPSKN